MKTRKWNIDLLAWKRKVRRMGGLLYYLGILPRLCFPVKGYFEIFPGFSNMYGNLATIIMVMVWLYICMNLLLYGAEINAYFEKEFRIAHKSVQELLAHEKEKKQQENE